MYDTKTIKINYTAYLKNDWKDIVQFHLDCLKQSDLINIADKITFFVYPQNYELLQLIQQYGYEDKINIVWNENNEYEYRAIKDIITNPFDYNLYFHSKGTSKSIDDPQKQNIKSWNIYMSNYMFADYKQCIDELNKGNDCVGVDFKNQIFPHYHGNFWWTRKEHIQKLQKYNTIDIYKDNRMIYEMLLCSEDCKAVSLCQSSKSLYFNNFTLNKWKTEPKIYDIKKRHKCIVTVKPNRDMLKLNNHEDIYDFDFISINGDVPTTMIYKNWKSYQMPHEIKDMEFEQQRKMIKSQLLRYLNNYDKIVYVDEYDEIKMKSGMYFNDDTVYVDQNTEKIIQINITNRRDIKQSIFFNDLATCILETDNEIEALNKAMKKNENISLNVVNI